MKMEPQGENLVRKQSAFSGKLSAVSFQLDTETLTDES
jgi:hypothetical protein